MTPKATHTHTHTPPRGEAKTIKARTVVKVCAQQRQKDDDMRRRTGRDKSVCGCNEKETKCTGTTDEPHLIVKGVWQTATKSVRISISVC